VATARQGRRTFLRRVRRSRARDRRADVSGGWARPVV